MSEELPLRHPQWGGDLTYYCMMPINKFFYVLNGGWVGEIYQVKGVKFLRCYNESGNLHSEGIKFTIDDYAWIVWVHDEFEPLLDTK